MRHGSLSLVLALTALATSSGSRAQPVYHNPIIPGFAPDPSCIRVNERFFCVTSSFSAFPGIPVYTSTDLVDWEQIGNVFSRPEQLPGFALVNTSTSGIWAPTIRFHNSKFYVTTTLVRDDKAFDDPSRWDNVIFTTDDIFSQNGNGWSDPVHFSFNGYDTSLFWEENDKVFVTGSHYWRVFPAIQGFYVDLATGSSLSGDPVTLWNGTGGLAPEGPHIYRKDGFYYLLIAEGGTGLNHMVTMARSNTSIEGPYDPCPFNPVLTNANTSEYLQTVGHADIFDDIHGNFWSVALATRDGVVNFPMGRETIMVPVIWKKNEFPVFNNGKPGRVTIDMNGPLPHKSPPTQDGGNHVGQPQIVTFTPGSSLPRQFVYYRFPNTSAFTISPPGHLNTLQIMGSAENITGSHGGSGTATFVARRQDHVQFTTEVDLIFSPTVDGEEAGITVFLSRGQHFDLGVVSLPINGSQDQGLFVRLRTITTNSTDQGSADPISKPGITELPSGISNFRLCVQAVDASEYKFSYSIDKGESYSVVGMGDAHQVSGGFTGTVVGMFSTGNGRDSTSPAYFNNFKYLPVQGIF